MRIGSNFFFVALRAGRLRRKALRLRLRSTIGLRLRLPTSPGWIQWNCGNPKAQIDVPAVRRAPEAAG